MHTFERWKGNKQIAILDFGNELIQRAWGWAADNIAKDAKVSVMTGTNIVLNARLPGDAATKMGTDVGKYSHSAISCAKNVRTILDRRPLPAIDLGARKIEPRGDANGILFKRAKIYD